MNELYISKNEMNALFDGEPDELFMELIIKKKIEAGEITHYCEDMKWGKVKRRMSYQCSKCGFQIYPLKGTILEKTTSGIYTWLGFINELFSNENTTIADCYRWFYCGDGKSLEYTISYKTAHRIYHLIKNNMICDKLLLNKISADYINHIPDDWIYYYGEINIYNLPTRELEINPNPRTPPTHQSSPKD